MGMDRVPFMLEMSKMADEWSLSDYLIDATYKETDTIQRLSLLLMKTMRNCCENTKELNNVSTIQMIQAMKFCAGKLLQAQAILQEQDPINREGLQ